MGQKEKLIERLKGRPKDFTFEEAEAAGSERRQAYAKAHRRVFAILAVIMLAVSAVTHVLHWSMWIDFTAATLGTIAAAVSTIRIRL